MKFEEMKCLRNSSRLNSSLTFGYAKNFPKVVVFLPSAFIIHGLCQLDLIQLKSEVSKLKRTWKKMYL